MQLWEICSNGNSTVKRAWQKGYLSSAIFLLWSLLGKCTPFTLLMSAIPEKLQSRESSKRVVLRYTYICTNTQTYWEHRSADIYSDSFTVKSYSAKSMGYCCVTKGKISFIMDDSFLLCSKGFCQRVIEKSECTLCVNNTAYITALYVQWKIWNAFGSAINIFIKKKEVCGMLHFIPRSKKLVMCLMILNKIVCPQGFQILQRNCINIHQLLYRCIV